MSTNNVFETATNWNFWFWNFYHEGNVGYRILGLRQPLY